MSQIEKIILDNVIRKHSQLTNCSSALSFQAPCGEPGFLRANIRQLGTTRINFVGNSTQESGTLDSCRRAK